MQGWAGTHVFVNAFQIFSVDLIVRAVKQVLVEVEVSVFDVTESKNKYRGCLKSKYCFFFTSNWANSVDPFLYYVIRSIKSANKDQSQEAGSKKDA